MCNNCSGMVACGCVTSEWSVERECVYTQLDEGMVSEMNVVGCTQVYNTHRMDAKLRLFT